MISPFRLEPLNSRHDRTAFASDIEALDRYFREQVTQDIRRRVTACYVAVEAVTGRVAGYYTLAAAGIPLTEMPEPLAKKLPRYSAVPVARLSNSHFGDFTLFLVAREPARSFAT